MIVVNSEHQTLGVLLVSTGSLQFQSCASLLHKLRKRLIVIASLWNTSSFLLFHKSQQHKVTKPSKCAAGMFSGRASMWISSTELMLFVCTWSNSQKTFAKGHPNMMCHAVSISCEQTSHVSLSVTFFLNKFSLAWILLLSKSQAKNCTLRGARLPQINLARASCCCPDLSSNDQFF